MVWKTFMRMKACGMETKKSSEVRTVTDPETVEEAEASEESRLVRMRSREGSRRTRSVKTLCGSEEAASALGERKRRTKEASARVWVRVSPTFSRRPERVTEARDQPGTGVSDTAVWVRLWL